MELAKYESTSKNGTSGTNVSRTYSKDLLLFFGRLCGGYVLNDKILEIMWLIIVKNEIRLVYSTVPNEYLNTGLRQFKSLKVVVHPIN